MSNPASLYDLTVRSHLIVESFLLSNGYSATASQLRQDASASGLTLPPLTQESDPSLDLKTLVESYNSSLQAQNRKRLAAQLDATHASRSIVDPLTQTLAGPSTLPFQLQQTHRTLHAANILSIYQLELPRRQFDTSTSTYRNSLTRCIATTAADRRIVLSDAETGDVEEILEDAANGHQAAVLCVAQDPSDPRCLISSGMDSKVVVWDLLTRKPVQTMKDHAKFVVKVACSPSGDYIASAGYDRRVIVYKRTRKTSFLIRAAEAEEDEIEDLQGPRYEKVFEFENKTNPEALLFVRGSLEPEDTKSLPVLEAQGAGEVLVRESRRKRTWLAFTVRNDSFIHYVALPTDADQDSGNGEGDEEGGSELVSRLENTDLNGREAVKEWMIKSFNTNPNPEDLHVSYSLMALSLHPSGLYICVQTGDHTMPNMASSSSSSAPGPLSRLLLLPILSSRRASTVWTGVPTSSYAVPRHAWLPSGKACWLNAEDGVLRLVDLKGKTRAQVLCHGTVEDESAQSSEGGLGQVSRASGWRIGGNTIIKDVVALNEFTVASCGFDRTVRILHVDPDVLS